MSLSHKIEIAMPNEIFSDMKDWLDKGLIKSVHHQEFVYSYYYLLTYLWRYCKYTEKKIVQSDIKESLGYNRIEKRVNYIMKENGLLDYVGYTASTKMFPTSWTIDENGLSFQMVNDYDEYDQRHLTKFKSNNYIVKEPLKHTGTISEEGCYWNIDNTHMVDKSVFELCMSDNNLGVSAFYLYGILTFLRDKSVENHFPCANETIMIYSGWGIRKITKYTNALSEVGLIKKKQIEKRKGAVNHYSL